MFKYKWSFIYEKYFILWYKIILTIDNLFKNIFKCNLERKMLMAIKSWENI